MTTMYPPHADHRDKDDHLRDRTVKAPAPVRYRLRPVEFDVRQMPTDPEVDLEEIRAWCNGRHDFLDGQHCIRVDTDGPLSIVRPGDYILKKPRSTEVFVVREKDFRQHYEKVLGYR